MEPMEQKRFDAYERSRHLVNRPICQAPFNSMYFNVYGEVGPCWLNLVGMGRYPEKSIRDIWFGEEFSMLRKQISKRNLSYKCNTCKRAIVDGNHHSVLSKLYDHPYELTDYPAVMEFELSNRCNLECVMCKGDLSSTIRKNRERRPPLEDPYDEAFIDQLDEFIPYLKEAKFLGGEPFLIEKYYAIWQKMARLNPSIELTVTTNGTVLNNRVKQLLDQLRFNVIVSIDSFDKGIYAEIRKGGNFERVMENFHQFIGYTRKAKTFFQVSLNPLRRNMWQLHEYVDYCNEIGVNIWFNTVVYPHHESIKTLPYHQLNELYSFLRLKTLKPKNKSCDKHIYKRNNEVFENFLENQLKVWMIEQKTKYEQRVSDTKEMRKDELFHLVKKELTSYVMEDAYLLESEKQVRIDALNRKLDELVSDGYLNITQLATLAPSEVFEGWVRAN